MTPKEQADKIIQDITQLLKDNISSWCPKNIHEVCEVIFGKSVERLAIMQVDAEIDLLKLMYKKLPALSLWNKMIEFQNIKDEITKHFQSNK